MTKLPRTNYTAHYFLLSAYRLFNNMPIIKIAEVGRVKKIKRNIAVVTGLLCFMNGQLLRFSSGGRAIVIGFDNEDITVFILGDECKIRVGENVYSTQEEFKIPVGNGFIGRANGWQRGDSTES